MNDEMDLGTCCACQNPDKHVRNIISLPFRTPYGFGWGCFQCGLPTEGAIAVVCDECLKSNAEIREFVKGEALKHQRAPMSELTEPFEHDLSKHPEVNEPERAELEEMGVEFEDDPVVLYDPETGPVTDSQLRRIVEEVAQRREPQTVEVHNVYTLYELNLDGSTAEQKLVCFNRPQDWGDSNRWHYHRCKTEFESNGTRYINHCHLWQEVERNPVAAFQAIAPYLFMVLQPGGKPELCGRDFLAEEDFWQRSWGDMPPVFEDRDEWDYDPYPDEAEQDPIPVGGRLYCWRVWHPDQEQAVEAAQETPFPEPPFPSASYLYSLTKEGDPGGSGEFTVRDDEDQPLYGFVFGTHLENTPTLAQSWVEKGWQLESLGAMTRLAN